MNPNLSGVIAILMWSISPLLIIGAGEIPPFLMAAIALILASIILIVESFITKANFKEIIFQPFKAYILTTYGIGGYVIFWLLAFKHTPAFEANTLNYLWPMLLVFFAHVISKEQLSIDKVIGLILGFLGTILLFSQESALDINGEYFLGYVFALMGAIIWATYSVATRYVSFPKRSMLSFMLIPGLISLAVHLMVEEIYVPSFRELIFVCLLGLTRVSFVFWDYAMKHGQIILISSLSYFIPIISTVLLMIFGFVPRSELVLLSAFLVFSGCLVVNIKGIRKLLDVRNNNIK